MPKRIAGPLIGAFDNILLKETPGIGGITYGDLASIFPFSLLGIGYSLTVPLRVRGQIIGGLWLGFSETAHTFQSKEKIVVDGIAESTRRQC